MYEPTALYFYKAIFTVELLVAELLACTGKKRRSHYVLRLAAAWAVCIGLAFAAPVFAYNAVYCSIVFLALFGVSLLGLKFCYEESWVTVIFHGIAAYTLQHIAYSLFDLASLGLSAAFSGGSPSVGGAYGDGAVTDFFPIIVSGMRPSSATGESAMNEFNQLCAYCAYFIVYITTYFLGWRFLSVRLKDSGKFEMKISALFVFVVCFVLFNIIASSLVTYYSGPNFDAFYVVMLSLYNIACSFFTMYLMIDVIYRKQLERGFTVANKLLKQSEEQYELAKQNMELINLKCHDLKHQIRTLGSTSSVSKEAIEEIEGVISIYDAGIRTGNEALDIILTEKSLYCNRNGIKLYCIVDGALLTFISDADLYSLFGNILDNAIEAVEKLEESKRFINLSVREINGFPRISASNCYATPPVFDGNGLPQTTKENKDLHGFGMKSIGLVAKKYNGDLTVTARSGMFELNVVFVH